MNENLLTPSLHDKHQAAGATMGDVAGWTMPLSYRGALAEAQLARRQAVIFDVSHIGRFRIRGAGALELLERLCTADVAHQEDDTVMPTLICNDNGGIVDLCGLIRLGGEWLLTCSPLARQRVWLLVQELAESFGARVSDQTERTTHVSIIGPAAETRLDAVLPARPSDLGRCDVLAGSLMIAKYIALRFGPTKLWALEVVMPNMVAGQGWRFITEKAGDNAIAPAGLAARDVLRVEAGLPAFGHELNETIDPAQAGLESLISLDHDFIGSQALTEKLASAPQRVLRQLVVNDAQADEPHIPAMGETVTDERGTELGVITSATFSPAIESVIAMAYLPRETDASTRLHIGPDNMPAGIRA